MIKNSEDIVKNLHLESFDGQKVYKNMAQIIIFRLLTIGFLNVVSS